MNRILKVLVIEDDTDACNALADCMEAFDDICLVAATNDASLALEHVTTYLPDAVILDLELHQGGGNGIEFLDNLNRLELTHHPFILVTTNNLSSIIHESARKRGADFILTKFDEQYSASYVVHFLRTIRGEILAHTSDPIKQEMPAESPMERAHKLMIRIHREFDLIGISPKLTGYKYLADAILLAMEDNSSRLIPQIAQKYKKSDASVERAMQSAINKAWRSGDIDDLLSHYTAKISLERGVPTTMEFIFYYVRKIQDDI